MKTGESSSSTSESSDNISAYTSDSDEPDNVDRKKREIAWCGVDTENHPFYSTSAASSSRTTRGKSQTPWASYRMQLFSKTKHNLAIYPDGTVKGTKDDNDLHTFMELMPGGGPGLVKIQGMLTNLFVAMNHRGKLYGERDPSSQKIIFIEEFQGSYTTYKSKRYERRNWYIGIKKNGNFKSGRKTKYGQKAISFLPRRKRFE
ncbi:unnamed protein product [Brassicogethes aeneus]|uniref:FGF n=1 Tax=Brassicogethes aeneus TaxID=1431903 RepID=A0A9P0BJT7_BRAAE|nr:unnamed protein product [Brassicogethes aeneus]